MTSKVNNQCHGQTNSWQYIFELLILKIQTCTECCKIKKLQNGLCVKCETKCNFLELTPSAVTDRFQIFINIYTLYLATLWIHVQFFAIIFHIFISNFTWCWLLMLNLHFEFHIHMWRKLIFVQLVWPHRMCNNLGQTTCILFILYNLIQCFSSKTGPYCQDNTNLFVSAATSAARSVVYSAMMSLPILSLH